ncbi:MAG: hypothetical protein HZB61_10395 [Nitrospirae bacterium]|nr:hypothetical protein [Nitrospirota bacterium]
MPVTNPYDYTCYALDAAMILGKQSTTSITKSDALTTTGSELVSNGAFTANTTGWTAVDATLASVAGGQSGNCLEITRTGGSLQQAYQAVTTVKGKFYRVAFYIKNGSSGAEAARAYIVTGNDTIECKQTSSASWTKYTFEFIAQGTSAMLYLEKSTATAGTMLFDEVSVLELNPIEVWRSRINPGFVEEITFMEANLAFNRQFDGALKYGNKIENEASVGTIAWASIPYAATPDGNYAFVTLDAGQISNYLKTTDFKFNIPTTATIKGVLVKVKAYAEATVAAQALKNVKLVKAGAISGNNNGNGGSIQTTPIEHSFGSSIDLWGLSLTPADVNASSFGCVVGVESAAGANDTETYIESIAITIYYNTIEGNCASKIQIRSKGQSSWLDLPNTSKNETWVTGAIETLSKLLLETADLTPSDDVPFELRLLIAKPDDSIVTIDIDNQDNFFRLIGI